MFLPELLELDFSGDPNSCMSQSLITQCPNKNIVWLAIWATGINTFFGGIWHQSACRKTPNGAPTWSSAAGEAVSSLCGVQPHRLECIGRSLPFHRLFNHNLKSEGGPGGQGVWKRPSNTFPGCELKVLQWCGSGKAKKNSVGTEKSWVWGWKWTGKNWEVKMLKRGGERRLCLSGRGEACFVGGEGRGSINNLLPNSRGGGNRMYPVSSWVI